MRIFGIAAFATLEMTLHSVLSVVSKNAQRLRGNHKAASAKCLGGLGKHGLQIMG